jgi:hypothetical protein
MRNKSDFQKHLQSHLVFFKNFIIYSHTIITELNNEFCILYKASRHDIYE